MGYFQKKTYGGLISKICDVNLLQLHVPLCNKSSIQMPVIVKFITCKLDQIEQNLTLENLSTMNQKFPNRVWWLVVPNKRDFQQNNKFQICKGLLLGYVMCAVVVPRTE